MKKIFSIVIATAMFASTTQADFKIKSVSKEKNMVSVDIGKDANVQPGNDLNVQWRDQECTLKVSKINGDVALADGRECEFLDKLKAGDTVTMSDFQHTGKYMETAPVSNPEVGRKKTTWENEEDTSAFGVTLAYNLAADMDGATRSYDGNSAPSIGLRYIVAPEYGWGFLLGLAYEFEREFDLTATTKASISMLPLEVNGLFRNNKIFGFLGLNMPIVISSGWSDKPGPGLGGQIGGGFFATPKLSIEVYYRWITFDTNNADDLNGAGLRAAYHF